MTTEELETLVIDLDTVSLGGVLANRETALAQAIQREINRRAGEADDNSKPIAGFNNFV